MLMCLSLSRTRLVGLRKKTAPTFEKKKALRAPGDTVFFYEIVKTFQCRTYATTMCLKTTFLNKLMANN